MIAGLVKMDPFAQLSQQMVLCHISSVGSQGRVNKLPGDVRALCVLASVCFFSFVELVFLLCAPQWIPITLDRVFLFICFSRIASNISRVWTNTSAAHRKVLVVIAGLSVYMWSPLSAHWVLAKQQSRHRDWSGTQTRVCISLFTCIPVHNFFIYCNQEGCFSD